MDTSPRSAIERLVLVTEGFAGFGVYGIALSSALVWFATGGATFDDPVPAPWPQRSLGFIVLLVLALACVAWLATVWARWRRLALARFLGSRGRRVVVVLLAAGALLLLSASALLARERGVAAAVVAALALPLLRSLAYALRTRR